MTSFAPSTSVIEHIEHMIPRPDRRRHGVWLFVRDGEDDYVAHFLLDEVPPRPALDDCRRQLDVFVCAISQSGGVSLVVALTRPGASSAGPGDGEWFRAVHQLCAQYRVPLDGVYLAGVAEVKEVFLDDVM